MRASKDGGGDTKNHISKIFFEMININIFFNRLHCLKEKSMIIPQVLFAFPYLPSCRRSGNEKDKMHDIRAVFAFKISERAFGYLATSLHAILQYV